MALRTLIPRSQLIGTRSFFGLSAPSILSSRKEYRERQLLNFSQEQVYNVVSNVEEYKQFVPYCTHSHVYGSHKSGSNTTVFDGELGVGFKMFEEKYMSKVTCEPHRYVQAVSKDAELFKELVTTWRFTPNLPPSQRMLPGAIHHPSCYIDFEILFEFASPLHAHASSIFFDQVSRMMLQAFVDRCKTVYNKP